MEMNCSFLVTTMQWFEIMQRTRMNFFFIPAALLTTCALLIDPLLIFCIFCNSSLRQETRYLLLANTLLSDILFLVFNLANVSSNAVDSEIPYAVCQVIMVVTVTAHCSSVLTVTLMVVDTFVAVRWPLHYNKILPPSRTIKIMGFLWVVAALYPLALLVVMEVSRKGSPQSLKVCVVLIALGYLGKEIEVGLHLYFSVWVTVCTVLILYCYIRLYTVTKSSGIWTSRYSRARRTLLAHSMMLLLYFTPGLIFTVELALFSSMDKQVNAWLNTVNLTVLMLLPRACSPYFYGLRSRKIYDTVRLMLWRRCLSWDDQSRQVQAS